MATRRIYYCEKCGSNLLFSSDDVLICNNCRRCYDLDYCKSNLKNLVEFYQGDLESYINYPSKVVADEPDRIYIDFEVLYLAIEEYLKSNEFWDISTPGHIKRELPLIKE